MKGGSRFDKAEAVDTYVIRKFGEAREKNYYITTRNLQEWAIQ